MPSPIRPPAPAPPAAAAPPAGGRARRWLAAARRRPALLVVVAALAANANTLANAPVLDDGWAIFDNPLVRGPLDLRRILREGYDATGTPTLAGVWRPVTTLTFALDHLVGGRDPTGYHLVNALLHALVAWLVLRLARRVADALAPARAGAVALAAGLVFALHPVHVEAVAGLVGRAEELAALLVLAALDLAAGRPRAPWRLAAATAAAALGALSKENAVVAPALLLLVAALAPAAAGLDAPPGLGAPARRRALGRALSAAGLLALGAWGAFLLRPGTGLGVPRAAAWFDGRPPAVVAGTMSRALAEYLRLLVFPGPLGLDFFYAARLPEVTLLSRPALLAAAAWGTVLVAGLLLARRAPAVSLGVLWIFGALVPVSNLVATGVFMAERLLYLPSVGFALLAGWLFAAARERAARARWRWAPAAVRGLGALVLAALAARTLARNADWRDARTLWTVEVRHAPLDPVVNNNLAVACTEAGDLARARDALAVVLARAPTYWRAWVNLGILDDRTGDPAGALRALAVAAAIDPRAASPHYFAARVRAGRGDLAGALSELDVAARLAPEDLWTRIERGRVLARLGRTAEAREELARAVALDPWSGAAREALAALGPATPAAPPP